MKKKINDFLRKPILLISNLLISTGLNKVYYAIFFPINRYLIWQSKYFKSLNIDLVVDIGANTGEFINSSLSCFKGANIIAFEPTPNSFDDIFETYKNNDKVKLFQVGLGEESKEEILFVSEYSPSNSIKSKQADSKELKIKINKLDSYVNQITNHKNIFIKIDVEGYEMEVLKGGQEFLSKSKYLYIETRTTDVIGCSFEEIHAHMNKLGWKFLGAYDSSFDENGKLIYFDSLFFNTTI